MGSRLPSAIDSLWDFPTYRGPIVEPLPPHPPTPSINSGPPVDEVEQRPPSDSEAVDLASLQRISAITAILDVVCQTTGMGFAAVARVTEHKWVACAVLDRVNFGLPAGGELPLKTTLCDEVRCEQKEIVIDDVPNDPKYADHHTPRIYGLRSYISVPITLGDGSFFGTLCAIDPQPAVLRTGPALPMFRLFAELIARYIDDQLLLDRSRAELAESRFLAGLRERFIAILGHDLRSPLAALQSGVNILLSDSPTDKGRSILSSMRDYAARMTSLIEDMLDLARGRLGEGISVVLEEGRTVESTLDKIVSEVRAAHPMREINVDYDIHRRVPLDHARIGQMLSNLLSNAIAHGSATHPVGVRASDTSNAFRLSVTNGGNPIAKEMLGNLFLPFYTMNKGKGLGLGLYIAQQIAHAHGGRLEVESDEDQTEFTFVLPVLAPVTSERLHLAAKSP